MNNNFNEYRLVLLNDKYLKELHKWNIAEDNFEQYTCRPLKPNKSFEEYASEIITSMNNKKVVIYILIHQDNLDKPLGKIQLFDFNPRNHSAEFGYYLPRANRGKGLGGIILKKFLDICFEDNEYRLNKLYATTSSNNIGSIKLLEKYEFNLDGKMREHYWINGMKYDQCIYSMLKSEWIDK